MIELRQNQIIPVQKGIEFFQQKNAKPSIIVAPTAFGKSILVGSIANNVDKTVVLQPSKELLEQNLNKLKTLGGNASVYSASLKTKEIGENITYATIGSVKNIGKEFKERGYKNLIVDEIHLYARNSDSMFGKFLSDSEITHVLGLTATPFKLQTNSMNMQSYSILKMLTSRSKHGNLFKEIIHVTQIKEMVELKYWTPLLYELYDVDTGSLIFNSTQADYTEESIELFYKNQNIETKIINKINQCERNKIIVFVPSVNDAIELSKKVDNSVAVYGNMDNKDREKAIKDFKEGSIKVVFNVNVLSVGFDYPEIDCIIIGRPTASLAWFYQALGRGTRIHPNKKDCLIVDFTGNVNTFGKIEDLEFVKEDKTWKLYGTGKRLLTGIPLNEIRPLIGENSAVKMKFGKYFNQPVSSIPTGYLQWMLKEFKWKDKDLYLKEEIEKVLKTRINTLKT